MLLDDDDIDEAVDAVDGMTGASPDKAATADDSKELAFLRERCARLEELAEYRRELLVESGARTQMLIANWPRPSASARLSPARAAGAIS